MSSSPDIYIMKLTEHAVQLPSEKQDEEQLFHQYPMRSGLVSVHDANTKT